MYGHKPKYPYIVVKLSGENGNIFNLIGVACIAMKSNGIDQLEVSDFTNDVFASKSYEEALKVIAGWVRVI